MYVNVLNVHDAKNNYFFLNIWSALWISWYREFHSIIFGSDAIYSHNTTLFHRKVSMQLRSAKAKARQANFYQSL